jgi:soluble lytic murein transglycosylase
VNTLILRQFCATRPIAAKNFGWLARAPMLAVFFCALWVDAPRAAAANTAPVAPEQQLASLSRALRQSNSTAAYARLSAFASRPDASVLGRRACLALGYFDYSKGRYAPAHRWLLQAQGDALLQDYALFWDSQANHALGHDADALRELKALRRDFPSSVLAEQALQALGETALALNQPEEALAALSSEPAVAAKPALLFLRARALEQAGRREPAAADYVAVYYRFPLSPEAAEAGEKAKWLEGLLGSQFPAVTMNQRLSRAAALFDAHKWRDAQEEYLKLLPQLSGVDRERAELREAECRVERGAGPAELVRLTLGDPGLDAERLYALSQAYRTRKQEAEMLSAIEAAVSRAPASPAAGQALFAAGNYYWVQLDRDRAAGFYQRMVEKSQGSKDTASAQWRVAWTAYLARRSEAAGLLEEHLRRFPGSAYTTDALYWLGRAAERTANPSRARGYFEKLSERFPQTYFGGLAAQRLAALGPGPAEVPAVLETISPPPPAPALDEDDPPSTALLRERAQALHSIAFDASEELEYRAAHAASGDLRMLLDAANAAIETQRYAAAIVTTRQLYPQLEAHRFGDVPREVWQSAYPLPFAADLERSAGKANLDPMLIAGLIRQESAFDREAKSRANALGLMQLLPQTARKLARQLHLRYSQAQLFDPQYNLRLGTVYFAGLRASEGSTEAALAAYNAGEDRVAMWQAGQKYEEAAEFVESIPFTETREYVQIVTRNAAIYRALYEARP